MAQVRFCFSVVVAAFFSVFLLFSFDINAICFSTFVYYKLLFPIL